MNTKTLEEIEQAVSQLSPEDFAAFREWFAKFDKNGPTSRRENFKPEGS